MPQGMIEQHQVIERVGGGNGNCPAEDAGDVGIGTGDVTVLDVLIQQLGVHDVEHKRTEHLNNEELQYVLLAAVGEVLGLLPVRQLVWLLAQVEGEEVRHFLLVFNHYEVHLLVFHFVLR